MKLAALCCTYLRPHSLGELIESFKRQDYPLEQRELIILDDAGQYQNVEGKGWRIVSIPRRFQTLGDKRNACAALASSDVEGFLVADDDDIYLPHWFSTQAEALKRAEWSRPGFVLNECADALRETKTNGLYHGGWAYRKEAFYRVRGYSQLSNGEDQEIAARLNRANISQCDPCEFAEPFYIYRLNIEGYHLSYLDQNGYQRLGSAEIEKYPSVNVGWKRDYSLLPVRRWNSTCAKVSSRSQKTRVELIGAIHSAGANGPQNGMYSLQRALRNRIEDGLDWLSIKSLPVSEGALPWFWCWEDRRYACEWDAKGLPFIQGPNMMFINSWTPRIDKEECTLLDSLNTQVMFCHSEWYRDHIESHRGELNISPIVLWPYPIDPWPGEPLPAKYDLLIYAKSGNRPQLLEHLADLFPRHIQIHYGSYQREELFEAARQSLACVYLSDDDHGPLALQEILLAGCPTVGVRRGASFVKDGETGYLVNRLPPGLSQVKDQDDATALTELVMAIENAQSLDRNSVRERAAIQFDTEKILTTILSTLEKTLASSNLWAQLTLENR